MLKKKNEIFNLVIYSEISPINDWICSYAPVKNLKNITLINQPTEISDGEYLTEDIIISDFGDFIFKAISKENGISIKKRITVIDVLNIDLATKLPQLELQNIKLEDIKV